jgi:NADPH:quinone reductase-like Zn-dependent oxidoreductase
LGVLSGGTKGPMKAAVYTKYGPPEVVGVRDVEQPTPRDDQLLIRVHATTVNVGDVRMRAFRVPLSFWLPARLALGVVGPRQSILGMELSGVVEGVGKNVTRFAVGDAVFGSTQARGATFSGGHAEYACLFESGVIAKKPPALSHKQAATLGISARTALYFLRAAKIESGQKVLIYGASGSVGTSAVQLAKHFGAEVTAVCSGPNHGLVRDLGASETIDYRNEDFSQNRGAYDVVFDVVGLASYAACLRALKSDGTYLQAVAAPGIALRMGWTAMISQRKTVGGGPRPLVDDLEFLGELVVAGKLMAVIDRTYTLDQIVEAHRYVDTGHKRGNVVIEVAARCDRVDVV